MSLDSNKDLEQSIRMAVNLSFCGSGFLGIYHVGVISCVKFYAKKLLDNIECVGGCSSGALAAAMLVCDVSLEECVSVVMRQASKVHQKLLGPFSSVFDPSTSIRKVFTKHLPSNAYEIATGKLFISLTRVSDQKNVVVSEYSSNNELIDALVCTCFIPFLCGMTLPTFKGVAYVDGGFTDNFPQQFQGTTITVSPFGGENDICPNDRHKSTSQFDWHNTKMQFSCHNLYRLSRALFPPDNDVLVKMCFEGFNDALKYLYKNYSDMLDFNMAIASIPEYWEFSDADAGGIGGVTSEKEVVDGSSLVDHQTSSSAPSDDECLFSEFEQKLTIEKVLGNFIFPNELLEILQSTKLQLEEEKLHWSITNLLSIVSQWIATPYRISSNQVKSLSEKTLNVLLPKLKWVGSCNYYTNNFLEYASEGFKAYKETAHCEWHPSINEENQFYIRKSRERLKTAEKSLVILAPSRRCNRDGDVDSSVTCSKSEYFFTAIHTRPSSLKRPFHHTR